MTKHERRQYFERLVQLRALYRIRGGDDFEVGMPIDEAVAYAERLMGDVRALAVVLGPALSPRSVSTVPESRES